MVDVLPAALGQRDRGPQFKLPPRPLVRCSDEEWPKIVRALLDRGLVRLINRCPRVGDFQMKNGAFGVPKPGKVTESGKPALRFIVDLHATNYFLRQIEGDTHILTGAATFQRIVVDDGKELLISGEDLTSAFY